MEAKKSGSFSEEDDSRPSTPSQPQSTEAEATDTGEIESSLEGAAAAATVQSSPPSSSSPRDEDEEPTQQASPATSPAAKSATKKKVSKSSKKAAASSAASSSSTLQKSSAKPQTVSREKRARNPSESQREPPSVQLPSPKKHKQQSSRGSASTSGTPTQKAGSSLSAPGFPPNTSGSAAKRTGPAARRSASPAKPSGAVAKRTGPAAKPSGPAAKTKSLLTTAPLGSEQPTEETASGPSQPAATSAVEVEETTSKVGGILLESEPSSAPAEERMDSQPSTSSDTSHEVPLPEQPTERNRERAPPSESRIMVDAFLKVAQGKLDELREIPGYQGPVMPAQPAGCPKEIKMDEEDVQGGEGSEENADEAKGSATSEEVKEEKGQEHGDSPRSEGQGKEEKDEDDDEAAKDGGEDKETKREDKGKGPAGSKGKGGKRVHFA